MKNIRLLSISIFLILVSCKTVRQSEDDLIKIEGAYRLAEAGDIHEATSIAKSLTDSKNPEVLFVASILFRELALASSGLERRRASECRIALLEKSQILGAENAANELSAGYQYGDIGMNKDPDLAQCWDDVESGIKPASACTVTKSIAKHCSR